MSRIFFNLSFTVWQPAVIRLCHLNLHRSPFRGYNPCSYSVLFPTRFRLHDGVWRIQVSGHSVHQGMHQLLSYGLNLTIQPLYCVVGTNPRPVLGRKIHVCKRFFDVIFQFLDNGRAFHFPELFINKRALSRAISLLSCE